MSSAAVHIHLEPVSFLFTMQHAHVCNVLAAYKEQDMHLLDSKLLLYYQPGKNTMQPDKK